MGPVRYMKYLHLRSSWICVTQGHVETLTLDGDPNPNLGARYALPWFDRSP